VNGVEPYAYMKAVLEAIAAGHPAARIVSGRLRPPFEVARDL
jgi:hypothetical protein